MTRGVVGSRVDNNHDNNAVLFSGRVTDPIMENGAARITLHNYT